MDATFKALAALALQSIPTIIFFIFLTHFLKRVYFEPVAKILEERRRQTEGMRELAERASEAAKKKGYEFESAIMMVRGQIMQENDAQRKKWAEEEAQKVAAARAAAEKRVAEAKLAIAKELDGAKGDISSSTGELSARIVDSLLRRSAA